MGTMPIGKLLISMSLPMIVSMLVQALYNVVDSMFVAQLSENALTSVSLAFPFQNLMIGIAVGTGVGVNALLSKSLGEKNYEAANKTAVNSLFLAGMSYIVVAVLALLLARPFFTMQTTDTAIVDDGIAYLLICCVGSFGMFFVITLEKLLQSTGRTLYSMVTQMVGALINIVFDPIMIFGLFGFPKMGVAGAALATILGQIVSAGLALYFNLTQNTDIQISFKGFRPDMGVIRRIYAVGIPSIIMTSIGSVMNFGMNKILIGFTPTATAVFGVYFKLQSFVFMPVFGINNGMVPIISYNYGARNRRRITDTIKYSMVYATCIMLTGLAVCWLFTPQILGIFNASQTMLDIGIPAIRTISLSYTFAGVAVVTLSVCQALGRGMLSLIVSTIRQVGVLLPLAYVLSKVGGLSAVWLAYPVAEVISVLLCVFFLRRLYKETIQPLDLPLEGGQAAQPVYEV